MTADATLAKRLADLLGRQLDQVDDTQLAEWIRTARASLETAVRQGARADFDEETADLIAERAGRAFAAAMQAAYRAARSEPQSDDIPATRTLH